MKFRFTIKNLMIITALVALPVALYAPELRSLDRNARVVLVASAVITAITLVSFTPVWVVLLDLRRRSRRGLGIRAVDYAALFVAFLLALGIIVAIGLAIMWMVVR
jgi:hypothetical protein